MSLTLYEVATVGAACLLPLLMVELDIIVFNEVERNDVEYNSLRCYNDAERAHQYYSSSIRSFPAFLSQQQLAISRIRFYMTMIIIYYD